MSGTIPLTIGGAQFLMRSRADDGIVTKCYYGDSWEAAETTLWSILSAHAKIVLDIGANTGVYSLLANQLNPEAQIYAFEPHPGNYKRLVENIDLNRASTIRAYPLALGDTTGRVEFTVPDNEAICDVSSRVAAFSAAHYGLDYKVVEVEQVTVDAFVDGHAIDRVDLMKIDVESFELQVIQGARETLLAKHPLVMIEVFNVDVFMTIRPALAGKMSRINVIALEELVKAAGYHILAIGERGLLRVNDFRSIPDGGANYLLVPGPPQFEFAPFVDRERILALLG